MLLLCNTVKELIIDAECRQGNIVSLWRNTTIKCINCIYGLCGLHQWPFPANIGITAEELGYERHIASPLVNQSCRAWERSVIGSVRLQTGQAQGTSESGLPLVVVVVVAVAVGVLAVAVALALVLALALTLVAGDDDDDHHHHHHHHDNDDDDDDDEDDDEDNFDNDGGGGNDEDYDDNDDNFMEHWFQKICSLVLA